MITLRDYLRAIKQKLALDRIAYVNMPLLQKLIKNERASLPADKDECWKYICSLMTPEGISVDELFTWGDSHGETVRLTTIEDPKERLATILRSRPSR